MEKENIGNWDADDCRNSIVHTIAYAVPFLESYDE
jgi:hypothetical protein